MTSTRITKTNIPTTNMLKPIILCLPALLFPLSSIAESFTAKRAGQGFTSLTQDFTSSLSNPALLTKYDDDDDVFVSLNAGIMAADQYDVVSTVDDISEALDQLESDINAIGGQNFQSLGEIITYNDELFAQVDDIVADFISIDEKIVNARNGLNLQILIPNKHISTGLFINQYGRVGALMDYSPGDEKILNDAVIAGELDLDDLESAALVVGYSIAETGFMLGYSMLNHVNYDVSIGTKIKYQRIDLYYSRPSPSDFEDDDDYQYDDDEYLTDDSNANIDLGLYVAWGEQRQWSAALVTNNLIEQTVYHDEQDLHFNLAPTATLGLSYENDWINLATEIDLIDRNNFVSLSAPKYASVGSEFKFAEHVQFRLGYRTDLNDYDEDIFTTGIGISPWDIVAVDIAAFTGDNDTLGAALQFSFKI